MHMPAGSPLAPILSCGAREQLAGLRRALAPQRWPLDPALLPADALLVGGAVRDALLGRLGERPDLDLVVEGDAVALARSLARRCGGSCVVLDAERSIARLVLQGWSFDLARRMGASLEQDLARRDYSVNAIALPLAALALPQACDQADEPPRAPGAVPPQTAPGSPDAAPTAPLEPWGTEQGLGPIDPGGGLADLQARRLRALGEANLLEDPLRLLRGVRLACELGFTIEARTLSWIHTHHLRLGEVAGERVLAELERLAAAPEGHDGLRQVLALGLLRGWQGEPQAPGRENGGAVEARTDATCERWLARLTPDRARRCGLQAEEQGWALPLARLAALLPPPALQQLRASRRLQLRGGRLRLWLQRLENATAPRGRSAGVAGDGIESGELSLAGLPEEERLALQRELEEDLPALALHLEPLEAREALRRWRDGDDPLFHPRPPLDGRQLQQQLGIPAGPGLGALLAHLCRERAFGRLETAAGPEAVLQVARHWLAECGGNAAEPHARGQAP